ncbi:MAG: hypothetical protein A3E80_06425 [Chlamydiae bacterium RIFCSPHIGHO2_12_FULL_49_9]|nr:MAG: hypothetical protein A3E80_06425 [Chlamydiae bacterium RIFCSPHIGHO2_12_FULL_49_9]
MQFNQAIPATWALTLGDALAVIMLDSERARLLYEVAAKNALVEGKAAQKSADATKETYEKQADATLMGAIGDISSAGMSAVGEGISIGMGMKYNSDISKTQANLDRVNANNDFIDRTATKNPTTIVAARASVPGSKTEAGDVSAVSSMDPRADLSAQDQAKTQLAEKPQQTREFFEKLQSRAADEKASLEKRLSDLNTQKQQAGQSWRNFSQYSGMAIKSGFTFAQAAAQSEFAECQKTQILLNFFADMTKAIQQTLQSSIDTMSSQMLGKANALILAVAESNRA